MDTALSVSRYHPSDADIVALLSREVCGLSAVYRYGSAGGPYERADSDIDLAILADHALSHEQRLDLMTRLAKATCRDIDLNDLRTLPLTLRVQIVMEGVRLYARDRTAAELYDTHTLSDYVRLNEERAGILADVRARGSIYG
ncbi:MAG: hypothetical protein IPH08_14630 [Rhodocyclaceae bacterium]|nr:hypothetical protein [Rhodocyclaceae bacterium]